MYFIFSKLLYFLILPVNWILATAMLALIVKKARLKRLFAWLSLGFLLIFTNPFLLDSFANLWNVSSNSLPNKNYSCAIVLGGYSGWKIGGRGGAFNFFADRFIQAAELQSRGKVSHLLLSGGQGGLESRDYFTESDWVKTQLEEINIPDSCIYTDNRSRNTVENAAFSKQILIARHQKAPYVLITSAFHMRRSLLIFKKAGVDVIPYSCNFLAGRDDITIFEFLPSSRTLFLWEYYLKEVVGYLIVRF